VEEKNKISVVIPVFNEEGNLAELYNRLKDVLENDLECPYEIIFVDDGSTDSSFHILSGLAEKDTHLKVIQFQRNFGQTAAIAAGFNFAEGEIIIPMDADLQNDPTDILLLHAKVEEGYDIVSGWRRKRKDAFITRRLPSQIANWIISRITGVYLHDYGCTLKAYRKHVVKNINLYGEMHRFIPAIASWMGVSIGEIEVKHNPRKRGTSKYNLSRTPKVILDLINVKFLLSYSTRPIQIFGGIGMATLFLGGVSFLILIVMKVFMEVDMTGNPFLFLSILFVLLGVQFVSIGLLAELSVRTYHESQGKPIYTIKDVIHFESKETRISGSS
jgi:glycosyltransferase involved in cell wall biosynthesis